MSLIRRDDSTLLVIDTQEGFYGDERGDVDRAAFELFVARVAWVSGLARALEIPVVVTEEDPETNGPTAPGVLARLPAGAPVLTKPVFAAADNPAIRAALDATGRHTVVAVGLETDVCVAHSAVSLIERGYHVAAVTDAALLAGSGARARTGQAAGRGRAAALGEGAVLRLGARARGRQGAGSRLPRARDAARLLALTRSSSDHFYHPAISGTTIASRSTVASGSGFLPKMYATVNPISRISRSCSRSSSRVVEGSTDTIVVFSISS